MILGSSKGTNMSDVFFWYAILGRKGFQIAVGVFLLVFFGIYLYIEIVNLFKKPDEFTKKYNTLRLFTVILFSIFGIPSFLLGLIFIPFGIAVKDNALLYVDIPLILIGFFMIFCLTKNGNNSRKNKRSAQQNLKG
jgi:Ca2+/Na+ antiporter